MSTRVVVLALIQLAVVGCSDGVATTPEKPIAESNGDVPNPTVAPQAQVDVGELKPSTDATPARYDGLTIDEWRIRLKNLDPTAPQSASAVPGLIAVARDRNVPATTRRQAAHMLGRIGEPAHDAVPILIELLAEPDSADNSTFQWSARALALFGPAARDAAPGLIKVVEDGSQSDARRQAALETLTYIGTAHPQVVSTLISLLQRPPSADSAKVNSDAMFRESAAASLAIIGSSASAAIPALTRATADSFEAVRRNAIIAIGAMGGHAEPALPTLIDVMLSDESTDVRDEAGRAVANVGPPAVPLLERLLDDSDPTARRRAAAALGSIGLAARPVSQSLLKKLSDENTDVRVTAAEALWRITADANAIIPTLVQALSDEDRQIRLRASRQLLAMRAEARPAIEAIKALQNDKRSEVRRIATETLKKIEAQKQ